MSQQQSIHPAGGQSTDFQATVAEISRLLYSTAGPSTDALSAFGIYAGAIERLREVHEDWMAQATRANALSNSPNFSFDLFEQAMAVLDTLGSRVSVQAAVAWQWEKYRSDPAFAGIDLMLRSAKASVSSSQGPRNLPELLTLIGQALDAASAKAILHNATDDAALLSDSELLQLTDLAQATFGLPQAWIDRWRKIVKGKATPVAQQATNAVPGAPQTAIPASLQVYVDANMTDAGNAECFVAQYNKHFRYCDDLPKGRRWLVWDGQRWQKDSTGEADRLALNTMRTRHRAATYEPDLDKRRNLSIWAMNSENVPLIKRMVESASTMHPFATEIDQYDAKPWLVATSNGTLDLNSQMLFPPDRDDYLTMQLGTNHDDNAACPQWLKFLDEVFRGDQDLIKYIQRAVGYTLTGVVTEQCMFLCYGEGANGKSVLLETIAALMGDYAGNAGFDTFDAAGRPGVGEYLAMLRGKRYVTIIETAEDRRLDEAKIKAVTAGDPVTCRFFHANPFTYRPVCKIWFAMNHKPVIRGTDNGIWRRVRLIPFLADFKDSKDKTLKDRLKEQELPGILNWALEGLWEWQHHGLGTCKAIKQATAEYRAESDIFQHWFDDCCDIDPKAITIVSVGYKSFQEWCVANGERPPKNIAWSLWLKKQDYEEGRVNGQRVRRGFRIR